MIEVKICGLTRSTDAREAADAGATYLGAVLTPGYGRSVDVERAGSLFRGLDAVRVGVFVDPIPDEAIRVARQVGVEVIQLHGAEAPTDVARIRDAGSWAVWKGVRVGDGRGSPEEVAAWVGRVDGILFDAWHPTAPGGAGIRFDWSRASELREVVPPGTRIVLAGGLDPANVSEAIGRFRPDVVDVSSGVEGDLRGVKDHGRIRSFIRNASTSPGSDAP